MWWKNVKYFTKQKLPGEWLSTRSTSPNGLIQMTNYKSPIKTIISVIDFHKSFAECLANSYDGNCSELYNNVYN